MQCLALASAATASGASVGSSGGGGSECSKYVLPYPRALASQPAAMCF